MPIRAQQILVLLKLLLCPCIAYAQKSSLAVYVAIVDKYFVQILGAYYILKSFLHVLTFT